MYSIDHVVLAVSDLDEAAERLRRDHGLASVPGGVHPGWGTGNRIVPLGIRLHRVDRGGRSPRGPHDVAWSSTARAHRRRRRSMVRRVPGRHAARGDRGSARVGGRTRYPHPPGWRGAPVARRRPRRRLTGRVAAVLHRLGRSSRAASESHIDPSRCRRDGIGNVEIGGDRSRLRDWLGPEGDTLPLDRRRRRARHPRC